MNCTTIEELGIELSEFVVEQEDFQIGEEIGHGGFATVYVGMQISTGYLCAIKILNIEDLIGDHFDLYKREIIILAKCSDPFLLGFIGFTTKKPYAIVTEYISNGCLYDLLKEEEDNNFLDGTKKTFIAMGIAHGLAKLHEAGIIHRDLKSLNILLDDYYFPKICDFGLSRQLIDGPGQFMTTKVGTPHWMAPELFTNQKYDYKIDVYAYGMLLWEILTHSSPFKGKTALEIMDIVVNHNQRLSIPLLTPSPLKKLINACWNADPNQRPTCKEIYKMFSTGQVRYPDTDRKEIDKIVETIENNEVVDSAYHYEVKEKETPQFSMTVSYEQLSDPFSQDVFIGALHAFVQSFDKHDPEKFFQSIKIPNDIPAQSLKVALHSFLKLFEKNSELVEVFIRCNVHLQLPMKGPLYEEEKIQILTHMFTHYPELITAEFLETITCLIEARPKEILIIFKLYIDNETQLSCYWNVIDYIFAFHIQFLENGLGDMIFDMISSFLLKDDFLEKYETRISSLLDVVFESGETELLKQGYQLLNSFPLFKYHITDQTLLKKHIDNENLSFYAFSYISKDLPKDLSTEFISFLFTKAEKESLASHCLYQLLSNEKYAQYYVETFDKWINHDLPSSTKTIKLALKLLKMPQNSQYIPKYFVPILQRMINNQYLYGRIIKLFKLLGAMSPQIKQEIQETRCLEQYFDVVTQSSNSSLVEQALRLVDYISKTCYLPVLIDLYFEIPKDFEITDEMINLIKTSFSNLSIFTDCKMDLEKHNSSNCHQLISSILFC